MITRAWAPVLAVSCFFLTACSSSGQDCQSALDRLATCANEVCAAGDDASCRLLTEGRRTSLFGSTSLSCNNLSDTDVSHLLSADCATIAREAALLADGKADFPCPAYFPWCNALAPGNAPYRVNVISFAPGEAEVELIIPDVGVTRWQKEGEWYSDLYLTGAGSTRMVGHPTVPEVTFLLGVPSGTDSVWLSSVSTLDQRQIDNITVIPYQTPVREIDAPLPFTRDATSYALDQDVPDNAGVVGTVATWRNYRVVSVTLHPFRYNAARKTMTVATRTRAKIGFADLTNEPRDTVDGGEEAGAPAYSTTMVNYPEIHAQDDPPSDDPGRVRLVVISADPLVEAILPFVEMKERQGIRTELIRLGDVGNSPEQIKLKIADRYIQMAIEAVILVGDIADLPMYQYPANPSGWGSDPIPSDYWYGLLAGDDLLPEVTIGRIPGKTGDEVAIQVAKLIAYEEGDPNADWRQKILLIAHEQEAPEKYQACQESVRNRQYHSGPFNFMRLYGGNKATTAQLVDRINAGVGLIAYRGHGSETTWSSWNGGDFSFEAAGIQNNDKTPVVFSIACLNLAMQQENRSYGEQWMLQPNGGAVAFLGATIPSWTKPNDEFERLIFRVLLDDGVSTIGALVDRARVALLSQYTGDEATAAQDNVKMYAWLGDPTMNIGTTFEKRPEVKVGWCNLQWPSQLAIVTSSYTDAVYGQVWSAGVTEALGQGDDISAEIGYGPVGSDPAGTGWIWAAAQYNMDKGNNDEYMGRFYAPGAGTYAYTLRVKGANDTDWLYCDQDGSHNGIQAAQLGILTVTDAIP